MLCVLAGYFAKAVVMNGWGISTATDIVLAWMVGKRVFGNGRSSPSLSPFAQLLNLIFFML